MELSDPSRQLVEEVDRRVEAWQTTAEERRFDEIGWADDIREAIRLGKANHRPVFLFTHDGHMNVGRCWGRIRHESGSATSSPEVVTILNRSFVPVYLSNEDYAEDGPAPQAERERDRILREAAARGLSTGTVHVYVLDPDGHAA